MKRGASLGIVVASAACYSTLAVLARLAYEAGLRPLPLLVWRFAIVAVMLAAFQMARDSRALSVGAATAARFAVLGLAGYGLGSLCFFHALRYAPASVVAVLLYAYPAMVSLAAWVFDGRRPDRFRTAALLGTFAGCVLVIDPFGAGRVGAAGVVLGLGSAVGYAGFSYLSHRWMGSHPRIVLMTYVFAISAVLAIAIAVASGESLSAADWGPRAWWLVAAIVVVPTFAAVVLFLEGIRGLGAAQAAVVSTLEPLFTIALAAVVLGERLQPVQWMGAALVVAGIVVGEVGERNAVGPAPV